MSNTHRIIFHEPVWVLHSMALEDDPDFDGKLMTSAGDVEIESSVHGLDHAVRAECTCGADFGDDYEAAEQHLIEIDESPSGEQVSSLDVLRYQHAMDELVDQLTDHVQDRVDDDPEGDQVTVLHETEREVDMVRDELFDEIATRLIDNQEQ